VLDGIVDRREADGESKCENCETREKSQSRIEVLDFRFFFVESYRSSGVSMLQVVTEGFQKIDFPVYIAACSGTKCLNLSAKLTVSLNLSARLTVSSRSHLREDLEVRTSQTQEFHSDVSDCSRCRRVCN
jgi:hypothetical protein